MYLCQSLPGAVSRVKVLLQSEAVETVQEPRSFHAGFHPIPHNLFVRHPVLQVLHSLPVGNKRLSKKHEKYRCIEYLSYLSRIKIKLTVSHGLKPITLSLETSLTALEFLNLLDASDYAGNF